MCSLHHLPSFSPPLTLQALSPRSCARLLCIFTHMRSCTHTNAHIGLGGGTGVQLNRDFFHECCSYSEEEAEGRGPVT